ncbi:ECM1 [Candida theae]|uniref:ECM1 n=1 Tax=Candida theae TaxID=1198502 RepID=A0AAD5BJA7_9ASCO|nr:ECM1 [Candida theae]KAI5968064.1 ECM1 [Candida theae]
MAKKISKRSRAARRGEVNDVDAPIIHTTTKEAHENDGVRKSIIRTQIKNETLLNKKIEASRIRKQQQQQQHDSKKKSSSSTSLKSKIDRSDKLKDILTTKIDASIARAKYVQNARKSNWDKTNASIEIRNHMIEEATKKQLTEDEIEKMEEDEYVRKFYETGDDGNIDEGDKEDREKTLSTSNKFALLDEVEA